MSTGLALGILVNVSLAAFTLILTLLLVTLPNFLLSEEAGDISLPPFHTIVYIEKHNKKHHVICTVTSQWQHDTLLLTISKTLNTQRTLTRCLAYIYPDGELTKVKHSEQFPMQFNQIGTEVGKTLFKSL